MAQPAHESYWNQQKNTLNKVRSQVGDDRRRPKVVKSHRRGFEPLEDSHPLLTGSHASPLQTPPVGRHSRTPPSHLPRLVTPPDHKHESRLRGVKFDILPHVQRYPNGYHNGDDSWGEEESDDEEYQHYPQLPFTYPGSKLPMPVVMYPMILPPQPAPRKSKGKKKVRMRNSPVYLNSRDNTLHEPHFVQSAQRHEDRYRYPYDGGGGYPQDKYAFSHIAPHQHSYDPFDPDMNPVLARYTADYGRHRSPPSHGRYLTEPQKYEKRESPLVRYSDPPERYSSFESNTVLDQCAEDLLNNVLDTNMRDLVLESLDDYVTEYLSKAVVYDVAVDIVTEVIEDFDGRDIVEEVLAEIFFEDFIQKEIINPEVEDQSHEVITEVYDHYSNKRRRRDIRQVKRDTGDKLLDSLCLDYLLLLSARQGKIWTETEHVNKLFDGMVTSLLLEQLLGVDAERRNDIMNKPVRRHHEKMVTDVAVDTLLGELCPSLDEDMADLDEYEMGLQNNSKAKFAELETVLQGL